MENNEIIELQKELNKKTEEYNLLFGKYSEIIRKQTITDAAEKYKFVNPASKKAFIALALEDKTLNMTTDTAGNDTFMTDDGKTAADIFAAFAETDDGKSFISCGNSGGGALGSSGRSSSGGGYRYTAEQVKGMNPAEIAQHLNEPAFVESLNTIIGGVNG